MVTNSLGFRSQSSKQVPLKSKKRRILLMGDSHVEAVGVAFEDSFAGLLEEGLSAKQVEIFNAAAVSYSPKIHYLKAKYLIETVGFRFDELIVFIDISDMQNELVYENFYPEKFGVAFKTFYRLSSFLRKNSFVFFSIYKIIDTKQKNEFFKATKKFESFRADNVITDSEELYYTFFSDFNDKDLLSNPQFHGVGEWCYDENLRPLADKGLAAGRSNLKKLSEVCKKNKIKMTISVHPWQVQLLKGRITDYYTRSWETFAFENSIGFINLYPLFINHFNPEIVRDQFYIKQDNHWNRAGHKVVADYLIHYLTHQKF
jgi:hypothetical protein